MNGIVATILIIGGVAFLALLGVWTRDRLHGRGEERQAQRILELEAKVADTGREKEELERAMRGMATIADSDRATVELLRQRFQDALRELEAVPPALRLPVSAGDTPGHDHLAKHRPVTDPPDLDEWEDHTGAWVRDWEAERDRALAEEGPAPADDDEPAPRKRKAGRS